jgi:uncharacterized protein
MREVLAIFARAPRPGRVKTRLIPDYGAEGAAAIYEGSLRDVLELARAAGPEVLLLYDDDIDARDYFRTTAPDLPCEPQSEGDLGQRMDYAFEMFFSGGADRVVVIGTDSPTLPSSYIREAFAALGRADVVLGPAEDGGYYLIGIDRRAWPRAGELLEGVAWSTGSVLRQTLDRATEHALAVHLLLPWYDIDRAEDVNRAVRDRGSRHLRQAVLQLNSDA